MKAANCLLGLSVVLTLVGCDQIGGRPANDKISTNVALVKSAFAPSFTECPTDGGTDANPKLCKITITAKIKKGRCVIASFDKPALQLTGKGKTKIVWILEGVDEKFQFCPAQGDGVFLKDADDDQQITDMGTAKDVDGNAAADNSCQKHFRWRNSNTVYPSSADDNGFEYLVRFRNKAGTASCVIDPFIRNG